MKILRDWKVILAAILLFGAGAVTGSVLSFVHFKHAFERGFTVENWTSKTMGFLQKELKLTPEQEPKVRAIVKETGGGPAAPRNRPTESAHPSPCGRPANLACLPFCSLGYTER